ncbi:MAG: hypothetical protein JXA49_08040 [Actinobacteria bacterium]|nr:hypothetical protein [Actinomycetota bacterium]
MIYKDSRKSIEKQPPGDLMQRERSGHEFLDEDFRDFFKEKTGARDQADDSVEEVKQIRCYSCGKDTPATVCTCLNCGAPLDVDYKRSQVFEKPGDVAPRIELNEGPEAIEEVPMSLIDAWDEEIF